MDDQREATVAFYTRHPISAAIVRAKLDAARGGLANVAPEDLWPHDQDHYGGLEANDALARAACLAPGMRIADFCAGLGGPARYFAHRFAVTVTGIELTPARVAGAAELTRLVGLQDRVSVIAGDVTRPPLEDRSMDAVVSQEALLHVPDKAAAIAQAFRVLEPGGRLAFTDWVVHSDLDAANAAIMERGMSARSLQSLAGYRAMLEAAGFTVLSIEDLTARWGPILADRFAMYRRLREDALAAGTPAGDDDFYRSYARLVALVRQGVLGGARFTAAR
jgi:cyclopropane fatty-acyl-phospholipid synthase-like methyltransferase